MLTSEKKANIKNINAIQKYKKRNQNKMINK